MEQTSKRSYLGKWIWTAAVVSVNLILWAIPSDLAYNVAQQRDILLGRYTVDRMATILLVVIASALMLNGIWLSKKRKGKEAKDHKFRVVALSVSIVVSIIAADVFLRIARSRQYLRSQSHYHRVPNTVQHGVNKDVPPTAFSYPRTPAGYPDLEYKLTVDKRGFRNKTDLEKYDVVVLGDSFTEGSHVSDEQAWPVLLAQKADCTVYNLGMSAGSPVSYLETLKKFGLGLSPKSVICMLYEGNDFRGANFQKNTKAEHSFDLKTLFAGSPLRYSMKQALIRCLGPINSGRFKNAAPQGNRTQPYTSGHPLYAVSWLPVGIPDGPDAKYYAFKVKKLLAHFVGEETFLNSAGCQQTFAYLREIRRICDENSIRFLVVYAPDKPHTLLPLVEDKISPHALHAFMALKEKDLPPVDKLMGVLRDRLHIQESALEAFCGEEQIEFVSLTEPLRQRIGDGFQAYYTYDQHWTPIGHEVAADTLCNYIAAVPERNQPNHNDSK